MSIMLPINKLLNRLWQHMTTRRHTQFWLLLILMIAASFAEIISIGAVLPFLGALTAPGRIFEHPVAQPFIHALGVASANQLLFPLTLAFGFAAVMAGGMRALLLWTSLRFSFAVGADISNTIYRRTLYQPYAIHVTRNSSEVVNGIATKVGEVIFYILMPTLNLISASVILIVVLAGLLYIFPGIALIAFGCFALVYAFIVGVTRNRLKVDSQHIAHESTNVIKFLHEGLGGIRDVLINGSQEVFCAIYRNADEILRRAQGNNQFASQAPRYLMEAMAMLLIATLAYVLSQQPDGIATAIPMLAAMALGMQRVLPASQQAYAAWSTIQGAQASLQDALTLLDQPLPDYAGQPDANPLPFRNQISLKNIAFRYSEQAPWILKDIDIVIKKGSRVGFIGTTGSGKSTLLDIIMGLLQPTEGFFKVDDLQISADNNRNWQAHIAHVPQAIFLADSNIEQNIAFGVQEDQIDHERVRHAARKAQISEIIDTWPNQYQTLVGERGVQLSGGQRQRIGIARALYKHADVLIFDEATSALDNETEEAVMQAIEGLSEEITILIIAHRLTTIKNCTQVFELDKGLLINQKNE